MVVGLTNTGESVRAVAGTDFSIYEMMNLLFEIVTKANIDLGRTILEKLKFNFEKIKSSKPEDEKDSDNDCDDEEDDDEDVKKEIAKEIKNVLAKCFDIDFEDFNKNEQ